MIYYWLLLVGLMAYWIIRQSVGRLTKTSVWVLWLVMMAPALIWTTWALVYGNDRPLPMALAVVPFLICPVLYAVLVQQGRISQGSQGSRGAVGRSPDANAPPNATKPGGSSPSPENSLSPQKDSQKGSQKEAPNLVTLRAALEGKLETTIPRLLDRQEEERLEACFSWSTFYLRQVEYRPQAAICHGQLRTNPDNAYKLIGQKLAQTFSDRFLLLLQEGQHGKPFFAIIPNPKARCHALLPALAPPSSSPPSSNPPVSPSPPTPAETSQGQPRHWLVDYQRFLVPILLALTLFTTTAMGAELITNQTVLQRDWAFLSTGLPYSLALVGILLAQEGSHYLMARLRQLPATLPYFIPVPAFLGTFGAYTQLQGPVPDRKSLLDFSIAGPWAGLLVTVPLLGWGLSQSTLVPLETPNTLFNVHALDPRYSLLFFLLSKFTLSSFPAETQGLALHPTAIAGYIGLWLTTIKLLPIGSLCGGRIIHAMVGQRVGAIVGQVTRLVLLALSLVRTEFLVLALVLFFIPAGDRPALNDVSPLNNGRDFVGLVTLAIAAMILLPPPRLLIAWLG